MTTPWLLPGLFLTVFQEFVKCSNKDIEQIIKKEMSGDIKNAMFAVGKNLLGRCWTVKRSEKWLDYSSANFIYYDADIFCSFSAEREEPAVLLCRPPVQSHEGMTRVTGII